jgi:hypothetical protein
MTRHKKPTRREMADAAERLARAAEAEPARRRPVAGEPPERLRRRLMADFERFAADRRRRELAEQDERSRRAAAEADPFGEASP